MAKFIESIEKHKFDLLDNVIHENKPINIDAITCVDKDKRNYFEIIFYGTTRERWMYLQEKDRDEDYEKIINNKL